MDYFVKKTGSNQNPGTFEKPFKTINKAARIAKPGDTVTVHEGVYREWVNPRYGGSAAKRIVYKSAEGEKVTITGAEIITDWTKDDDIWKTEIDNRFFKDFNPYDEVLYGDWLFSGTRVFHLGEVYLDGRSMYEVPDLESVRDPEPSATSDEPEFSVYTWFCQADDDKTTIYANFHDTDPTKGNVEINVRPFCFWPEKPGCGYITVSGFTLKQAATQWAPPTALQEGLIGPHWSKGWIIENNIISDSRCTAISLGKDEATGQNEWSNLKFKQGTQREREVIFRAANSNWNKDNIGGHIVRGNRIFNCGQAGIVGHLGCAFSTIENNHIFDILHKGEFNGAETGGIKLHAAIDTVLSGNIIHNSFRGLWLDWQAQGTRVTKNVFFDNKSEDLFIEVSHGPTMVDHNIFLSDMAFKDMAQGIALVHNLFAGKFAAIQELDRYTPYHVPHSTSIAGVMHFMGGDNHLYNNLFLRPKDDTTPEEGVPTNFFNKAPVMDGFPASMMFIGYPVGSAVYNDYPTQDDVKPWDKPVPPPVAKGTPNFQYRVMLEQTRMPVFIEDNLYFNNAKPCVNEKSAKVESDSGIEIFIDRENRKVVIEITKPELFTNNTGRVISTKILGSATQPEVPYEQTDGTPYLFDKDFTGIKRNEPPTAGPFQVLGTDTIEISFT